MGHESLERSPHNVKRISVAEGLASGVRYSETFKDFAHKFVSMQTLIGRQDNCFAGVLLSNEVPRNTIILVSVHEENVLFANLKVRR